MASETKVWAFNNTGFPTSLHPTTLPATTTPPSPSHIIVRVRAAALNPVDIQIMNLSTWGLPLPMPPWNDPHKRLGEDFAGEVLAAGSDVKDQFAVGDKVMGFAMSTGGSEGTVGENAAINVATSAVVKIPPELGWSWMQAAALPLVWLTARTTIDAVEPNLKDVGSGRKGKVTVLGGSSSVGMYAVHLAKRRGWEVQTSCSGRNVEFVSKMGAAQVVDYTQTSVPEAVKEFAPDAIIDCVGGTETLHLSKRYVTIVGDKTNRAHMGGQAIYIWNPQMLLRHYMGRFGLGVQYDCVNLQPNSAWLAETYILPKDKIVIDSEFPMSQVKDAFERLNTGRCNGKVVINIAA